MPSYKGSSLEFTKNNLIQIVGIKEANIEVVEVSTAPDGTAEGTVVEQSPKAGEKVDLTKTRVKISIYKPKHHRQRHHQHHPNVETKVLLRHQVRGTNKEINEGMHLLLLNQVVKGTTKILVIKRIFVMISWQRFFDSKFVIE